eukprot:g62637.t1
MVCCMVKLQLASSVAVTFVESRSAMVGPAPQKRNSGSSEPIPLDTFKGESDTIDNDPIDFIYEARKPQLKTRTLLTAVFLLFVGLLFGGIGLWRVLTFGITDAIPFLSIAFIGLCPGGFYSFIILRAWLGHKGWSYDQIPQYD